MNISGAGGQRQARFHSRHKEEGWKATASQQLTLFIGFRIFLPKLKSGKRFNEVWRSLWLAVYISTLSFFLKKKTWFNKGWPDSPVLLSCFPSGGGYKLVWGLNGTAERKRRVVINFFLKMTVHSCFEPKKKSLGPLRNAEKETLTCRLPSRGS